jgi:hypothetical protein
MKDTTSSRKPPTYFKASVSSSLAGSGNWDLFATTAGCKSTAHFSTTGCRAAAIPTLLTFLQPVLPLEPLLL